MQQIANKVGLSFPDIDPTIVRLFRKFFIRFASKKGKTSKTFLQISKKFTFNKINKIFCYWK